MPEREPSVHDNYVYAFVVDCEHRRITLHTAYRDVPPVEWTDVVFHDVVAHRFEHALEANILMDVEECDVEHVVRSDVALLAGSWRWGWPPVEYQGDLTVLTAKLRDRGVRGYEISGSYGLSGWVLAGRCERVSRTRPAHVGDGV